MTTAAHLLLRLRLPTVLFRYDREHAINVSQRLLGIGRDALRNF
jgi:hypothetical protein